AEKHPGRAKGGRTGQGRRETSARRAARTQGRDHRNCCGHADGHSRDNELHEVPHHRRASLGQWSAADAPPPVFVNVASKGLSDCISGLESTLTGTSASVHSKGVARAKGTARHNQFDGATVPPEQRRSQTKSIA